MRLVINQGNGVLPFSDWDSDRNSSAILGIAVQLDGAVYEPRPFLHAHQTKSGRALRAFQVHPYTAIGDLQTQLAIDANEHHSGIRRLGMFRYILESFLRNAIGGQSDRRR